jgi:hypothetical protein
VQRKSARQADTHTFKSVVSTIRNGSTCGQGSPLRSQVGSDGVGDRETVEDDATGVEDFAASVDDTATMEDAKDENAKDDVTVEEVVNATEDDDEDDATEGSKHDRSYVV